MKEIKLMLLNLFLVLITLQNHFISSFAFKTFKAEYFIAFNSFYIKTRQNFGIGSEI